MSTSQLVIARGADVRSIEQLEAEVGPFFNARSVSVIGASADITKPAGRPLHFLHQYGYTGRATAVNPRYGELLGVPCFPTVAALPETPDLGLVMLPAPLVLNAIEECGRKGIKHLVVYANGFADAGQHELQRSLATLAARYGIRIVGPNCLGVMNASNGLIGVFWLPPQAFTRGNVALLTQSGSGGTSLLSSFHETGIGISKWVAVGNEADTKVLDFANYVLEDPDTGVVALFIESVPDPVGWMELGARAALVRKPVVIFKVGRGAHGRRAAETHSGRISGAYEAWLQLATEAGLITVDSMDELNYTALALSKTRIRPRLGLAALGSGGHAVITSDECERNDVPLARLSEDTLASLRSLLPQTAGLNNPIDPGGLRRDTWWKVASILLHDPGVDALLVHIVSALAYPDVPAELRALQRAAVDRGKLLAVTYFSPGDRLDRAVEMELRSEGILLFPDSSRAVRSLRHLGLRGDSPAARPPSTPRESVGWTELATLLEQYGVCAVIPVEVSDRAGAADLVRALGTAVFKLEDPGQPHKSELGLVKKGITTPEAGAAAYEDLRTRGTSARARVVAQRQVGDGTEILVGFVTDPELGRLAVVGAGGILTEFLRDVVYGLCPLDSSGARRLLEQTKVWRLLRGFRGGVPVNLDALVDVIVRGSRLFAEHHEFAELEFNPVIVDARQALVVDVLGMRSR